MQRTIIRSLALAALLATPVAATGAVWERLPVPGGQFDEFSTRGSTVIAAAGTGVYRSDDRGQTWALIKRLTERVDSVLIDRGSSTRIYVGDALGYVHRSTDGGLTWSSRLLAPVPSAAHQVTALASHASDPTRLYATVFDVGILMSTDRGVSWALLPNQPADDRLTSLVIAPSDPDYLYVGVYLTGVHRSTSGGLNWSARDNTNLSGNSLMTALAVHPQLPNVLLAGDGNSIMRSVDGGKVWTSVANAGAEVRAVSFEPATGDLAYAVASADHSDTPSASVFKSSDEGVSWAGTSPLDGQISTGGSISIDGSGVLLVGGAQGIWRSTDQGAVWANSVSGTEEGAVHSLAVDGVRRHRLYVAGPGGVHRSLDGGDTWAPRSGSLPRRMLTAIATRAGVADRVYVADQRKHVATSGNGGASWTATEIAGFGLGIFRMLALPDDRLLAMDDGSNLVRRFEAHGTDYAGDATGIPDEVTASGDNVAFAHSPADPSVVYAGSYPSGVYRSDDGGLSFDRVDQSGFPAGEYPTALAVHPGDAQTVFAGTFGDGLFRSTDGGVTWVPINTAAGTTDCTYVRGLAIDPFLPTNLLAYCDNTGLLGSIDGGLRFVPMLADSATETRLGQTQSIAGTLLFDPHQKDRMFAAIRGVAYRHRGAIAVDLALDGRGPNAVTTNAPHNVRFDLSNERGGTARAVKVTAAVAGPGRVVGAGLPGGTCTFTARTVRCSRSSLPVGQTVTGTIYMEARDITGRIVTTVSATSRDLQWDGAPSDVVSTKVTAGT